MKEILRRIIKPIVNFFDQIIEKETERVIEFNNINLGGTLEKEVKGNEVSIRVDCQFADLSLKEIELGVRQIRKLCGEN